MNTTQTDDNRFVTNNPPTHAEHEHSASEDNVNPFYIGLTIFAIVGIGAAVALVVRSVNTPPTPRNRIMGLLEDIQDKLSDLSKPVYKHATTLVENSANVLSKGVDSISDLKLEKKLSKLSHWLRNLKN